MGPPTPLSGQICYPNGLRMKHAKDKANMIADIHKVGPFTCPKVFQYDNGSEFRAEMTRMLEKQGVTI